MKTTACIKCSEQHDPQYGLYCYQCYNEIVTDCPEQPPVFVAVTEDGVEVVDGPE